MEAIKAVRGTKDLLPAESVLWNRLEEAARQIFSLYGFSEIRTPTFEKTDLFARAVGEATDIVEKEMYTFPDRNGDPLTLRPEGTAGVVRAFIEHGLAQSIPWRVYYKGPMYRYERPQKGRYRQFHQIGCEVLGLSGPLADAELMSMILHYFRAIGIEGSLTLEINSLGCAHCRPGYREKLFNHLLSKAPALCDNCGHRLERNPLRVLDCKSPGCREATQGSPTIREFLCNDCETHFNGLLTHLNDLGHPYHINHHLVRGLDYYTRTAFEVTTDQLGAQNAVAAGGRYDALVSALGGPDVPAIGFAMGVERLAMLLDQKGMSTPPPAAYLVTLGEPAARQGLAIADRLRRAGLGAELDQRGGSMKSQMKKAGKSAAPFTIIIGEAESASNTAIIKEMANAAQVVLAQEEVAHHLANRLQPGAV